MHSISLLVSNCSPSGSGQGQESHFYILDSENFATASRRCIGTRRRSACGLRLRRSSASWLNAQVYYTLVDSNPLIPLLQFVLDVSYKSFLHCYAAELLVKQAPIVLTPKNRVAPANYRISQAYPRDALNCPWGHSGHHLARGSLNPPKSKTQMALWLV